VNLLTALLLILCGLIAAASFIIQKQPNAREYIDKLLPWQGWIGIIACINGAGIIITSLLHTSDRFLPSLVIGGLSFCLGFLMGYSLISHYLLHDSAEAIAKAQKMRDKLATIQIPLGLAALVVGAWGLLNNLLGR
jgi:hypothetical protein